MEQVHAFAPAGERREIPAPAATAAGTETMPASLMRWAAERGDLRAFTFVEYTGDSPNGVHRTLTWRRLNRRALAVGARISARAAAGDRVAILAPQGLDFVVGFLGCLYAGAIAVPMFTPDLPGHSGRLAAVLADCRPVCVLTTSEAEEGVREYLAQHGPDPHPAVEAVDLVPDSEAAGWAPHTPDEDTIAYLQYTSGSTRAPAGVVITHRNVVANARQCMAAFAGDGKPFTTVGWVPLFHDMGLVLCLAAPVVAGAPSVLMDPVAFLRQPARWLRLLSQQVGAVSAAPNVAYDLCVARIPEEERYDLNLDGVVTLINGSEPVRPQTIERFLEAFGPYGLAPEAHRPAYGLAEATVFVSSSPLGAAPFEAHVDRDELGTGRMVSAGPDARATSRLIGCGLPVGQQVRIVDPAGTPLPAGTVGEIWVRGPNVGIGYWGRSEQSAETFGGRLRDPGGTSAEGDWHGDWLRTGDLGAIHEDALFVTGRQKDLIIVDGRNHYPQDIELSVQEAHPAIRQQHLAAFSVLDGVSEEVVVVAEHAGQTPEDAPDPVAVGRAARESVATAHGVRLADFVLVPPGAIPRTSSGKVSRSSSRERYLAGEFGGLVGSGA
jgi:long-chain fatty acid adenylase/transferase FadD26